MYAWHQALSAASATKLLDTHSTTPRWEPLWWNFEAACYHCICLETDCKTVSSGRTNIVYFSSPTFPFSSAIHRETEAQMRPRYPLPAAPTTYTRPTASGAPPDRSTDASPLSRWCGAVQNLPLSLLGPSHHAKHRLEIRAENLALFQKAANKVLVIECEAAVL